MDLLASRQEQQVQVAKHQQAQAATAQLQVRSTAAGKGAVCDKLCSSVWRVARQGVLTFGRQLSWT